METRVEASVRLFCEGSKLLQMWLQPWNQNKHNYDQLDIQKQDDKLCQQTRSSNQIYSFFSVVYGMWQWDCEKSVEEIVKKHRTMIY